jgi:hypothetical protein
MKMSVIKSYGSLKTIWLKINPPSINNNAAYSKKDNAVFLYPKSKNRKEKNHMAKTKIEKIALLDEEIKQRENQRKRLIQEQKEQDRKDRTKRLCRRMGLFESLLPASIPLSEEQFKTFLEKTIMSNESRRMLDGFTAENAAKVADEIPTEEKAGEITNTATEPPKMPTPTDTKPDHKPNEPPKQHNHNGNGKSHHNPQGNGNRHNANNSNGTREQG